MQVAVQHEGTQGVAFGTNFTDNAGALFPALFRAVNDVAFTVQQQFTGVYWMMLTGSYDYDGMICWQVTRPYICNITAIAGFIQTADK
jgi:hypothetical protein